MCRIGKKQRGSICIGENSHVIVKISLKLTDKNIGKEQWPEMKLEQMNLNPAWSGPGGKQPCHIKHCVHRCWSRFTDFTVFSCTSK